MAGASRRLRAAAGIAAVVWATGTLGAGPARGESAWVKDELRLELRTGPGTKYRIHGFVETGDVVEVVQQDDGWTRVRLRGEDGEPVEGWIPEGHLQAEMPARMRLARFEEESAGLGARLEELTRRTEGLASENEKLADRDAAQRDEIAKLTRENLELRSGARWPDRLAGAAILGAGMLLGAVLRRGGRAGPRVRL